MIDETQYFFIIIRTPYDGKAKVPSAKARLTFRLPDGYRVLGIFPSSNPELQPEGEHFDATLQSVEELTHPLQFVVPHTSS